MDINCSEQATTNISMTQRWSLGPTENDIVMDGVKSGFAAQQDTVTSLTFAPYSGF